MTSKDLSFERRCALAKALLTDMQKQINTIVGKAFADYEQSSRLVFEGVELSEQAAALLAEHNKVRAELTGKMLEKTYQDLWNSVRSTAAELYGQDAVDHVVAELSKHTGN